MRREPQDRVRTVGGVVAASGRGAAAEESHFGGKAQLFVGKAFAGLSPDAAPR